MRKKFIFLIFVILLITPWPAHVYGGETADTAGAGIMERWVLSTLIENPSLAESNQLIFSEQEKQLMDGTADRINQYRKGDATVYVIDSEGRPLSNVVVEIEMLNHDFLFGGNCYMLGRYGNTILNRAYEDAFTNLFNYATLPFYWSAYDSNRDNCSVDHLKYVAQWAREHDIKTKGHPLVWASHMVPTCLPNDVNELDELVEKRITNTINEFNGSIDYWDVVNEPVVASFVDNPIGKWTEVRTPAISTAMALGWAHNACPEASMLVNDFHTDDSFHRILEDIQAAGGEFDAIGLQSHMHKGTWQLDKVWNICEEFKDFGIALHFSELTVLSGALKTDNDWTGSYEGWNSTKEGEAFQAEYVEALYTLLFSHPSVEAITWWDLSDMGANQGAPAGLLHKDMSPKPAYDRLKRLIHEEWWTKANLLTNEQGTANWRGFYGEYKITILNGPQKVETRVHLKKGQENIFIVEFPADISTVKSPGL